MTESQHGVAVRTVVRGLNAADDPVTGIHDGETWYRVRGEGEAMERILDLDVATLRTASGAAVFVTPFEDPADQIVDYPIRLSPIVDPMLDRYGE